MPEMMFDQQKAFSATGGLHASSLFTETGSLICIREDIVLHNALDRDIGAFLADSTIESCRAVYCAPVAALVMGSFRRL